MKMTTPETEILATFFDFGRGISTYQLESDVTVIQLRTLGYIYDKKRVKPTEIANRFDITPASVTSQIDTLVENGYLERIYSQDDKRVIEVTLTNNGKKVFLKAFRELKKKCSWTYDVLNEDEKETLIQLIRKIRKSGKDK